MSNFPLDRRSFVRSLGLASVASVATPALNEAEAYDPGRQELRQRYRETDHVKTYYLTNRYETLLKK